MALPDVYKALLLEEWDDVRDQVKRGLKRLGRDIPLAVYSGQDDIKLGGRKAGK